MRIPQIVSSNQLLGQLCAQPMAINSLVDDVRLLRLSKLHLAEIFPRNSGVADFRVSSCPKMALPRKESRVRNERL